MVAFCFCDRAPVVKCRLCGCYTEATCVGLGSQCPRRIPQGGPVYRRGRFLAGRHPRRDINLEGPYFDLSAGQALEDDLDGWVRFLGLPA